MGYLVIIRPVNCLITVLSVWVGAWIGGPFFFNNRLLAAGLAGFAACAFGNIINDLMDVEIDRINNPGRPLPSGRVSRNGVLVEAVFFSAIALTGGLTLGFFPVLLILTALIALFAYALFLKRHYIGNILVALTAGLSFLLGGIIGRNPICILPFIYALLVHWPREIIKDALDMEGDRAAGVISLPVRFGTRPALTAAMVLLVLCLVALPVPYLLKLLGLKYFIIVLAGAAPLLIFTIILIWRRPDRLNLVRASLALKAVMLAGLAGFLAG